MKIKDFVRNIELPIFTTEQAQRVLPVAEREQLSVQLSRWVARGELVRLKRGLYVVAEREVEELVLSNFLYQPSYVSMETVLHMMGIIPDVTSVVTAVTTGRPRRYETERGVFSYSKLACELFFGYQLLVDARSGMTYRMASSEKALLDYVYVRKIRDLTDARITWDRLDTRLLYTLLKKYPLWVGKEFATYV